MIMYCKQMSKMAALISPREKEKIKNHIQSAFTDFCAYFYDQTYNEYGFTLDMVFPDGYYKHQPLNAVYDYYINVGKTEKDAAIFTLLDLNCVLEEVLSEDSKVFTKNKFDKKSLLPQYMLVSF